MDDVKCFACGKHGHIKKECPEIRARKLANLVCYKCKQTGHLAKQCNVDKSSSGISVGRSRPSSSTRTFARQAQLENGFKFQFDSTAAEQRVSKVQYIDSHCHLNFLFDKKKHYHGFDSFKRKFQFPENFAGCVTIFCDPASFSSFGISDELLCHKQVWAAFGFHPHNAKYYNDTLEYKLSERLQHPKVVALGEIGLDYSARLQSEIDIQKEVFRKQVKLAELWKKPLVIHCRESEEDVFEILSTNIPKHWKIHLHCYTGSYEIAAKFLSHFSNLFLGITGIVTYPSAKQVQEVVRKAPIECILLETDAPYLVPTSLSSETRHSHSGMIPLVAQAIAKIKCMSLDKVFEHALANTKYVYGIP